MNRNVLKIIAVLTMIVDHIGLYLLNNSFWFRVIGRISMPLFAFFIAEGMKHTKNRTKYILTLLGFALISQIPHILVSGGYMLNILFTFLIAISIILIIENIKLVFVPYIVTGFILVFTYFMGINGFVDYGVFGVLLVLVFYFCKNKLLKLSLASLVLIILALNNVLIYGASRYSLMFFVALFSVILLIFYNGNKGKMNLKWFFYVFYPTHLLIIYAIKILM